MPRLKARGEAFEILWEYKRGDLDIGEAYDLIYDEITKSYGNTRSLAGRGKVKHKKRKLSAWNKFVKANSKKPRFRFANGKLKLKKMGVAFRRTPAGRKKK